jgi:hypothetical protein
MGQPMNKPSKFESFRISVKDSVLFNVSEEELEQFESIVHEHQIAHSALFLEELTARTYLYHPKEHLVFRPIVQGMIRYRQLDLPILSFQEWLEYYILETSSVSKQ